MGADDTLKVRFAGKDEGGTEITKPSRGSPGLVTASVPPDVPIDCEAKGIVGPSAIRQFSLEDEALF